MFSKWFNSSSFSVLIFIYWSGKLMMKRLDKLYSWQANNNGMKKRKQKHMACETKEKSRKSEGRRRLARRQRRRRGQRRLEKSLEKAKQTGKRRGAGRGRWTIWRRETLGKGHEQNLENLVWKGRDWAKRQSQKLPQRQAKAISAEVGAAAFLAWAARNVVYCCCCCCLP